jgi:hypothetical protein
MRRSRPAKPEPCRRHLRILLQLPVKELQRLLVDVEREAVIRRLVRRPQRRPQPRPAPASNKAAVVAAIAAGNLTGATMAARPADSLHQGAAAMAAAEVTLLPNLRTLMQHRKHRRCSIQKSAAFSVPRTKAQPGS